jgi:RNA polymerase sigma-70 factor (ECF subfamily)
MDTRELKKMIRSAMKGNTEAFEDLYHIFIKSILFHTRNLLDDKDRVEDTAQEIVIRMYKGIGKLKNPEALRSWMQTIIINTCATENLKIGKTGSENLDDYMETLVAEDENSAPDEAAERSATGDILMDAINKLPKARRQAVIMHYYDEMSYKEIATVLGISASTVSTNVLRAKTVLKEELTKSMKFDDAMGSTDADTLLDGRLFAPAVARSITIEVDAIFPDNYCTSLTGRFDKEITRIAGVQTSHAAPYTGRLGPKVHIISLALIIIAFIALLLDYNHDLVTPTDPVPWNPAVEILFENELLPNSQLNPERAEIISEDPEIEAIGWILVDQDVPGTVLREGSGSHITSELEGLPDGTYQLRWRVKNKAGRTATVMRDILIENS